jgi:hypothetical protein
MASSTVNSTTVGATSRGYQAIVSFASGTPVHLFGSGITAGLPVPRGEHNLTITTGSWSNSNGVVTAYPASGDSASLTLVDVEKQGVQQTIVKDWTGFSYVSTNPITDTQPLVFALASQNGTTSYFSLNRYSTAATVAGTVAPNVFSIALTTASYTGPPVYTCSLVTWNDLGVPPSGGNNGLLYYMFEGVNTSASAPGGGDWVANAETPRHLNFVAKGAGTIATSSNASDPVVLTTLPANTFSLFTSAQTSAPYTSTIGGFTLTAGVYRIRWRVTGYGVASFITYLRAAVSPAAPNNWTLTPTSSPLGASPNVYMGSPGYSSSTSTSSNVQSTGDVTLTVTCGTGNAPALFALLGICTSTNYVNGKGLGVTWSSGGSTMTTINNTAAVYANQSVSTERFSEVWVQILS